MRTGSAQTAQTNPGAHEADGDGSPPGATAIEAHGLTKTFGTNRAVDGIDLTVMEGEIFGVLGPNGAGKTVTLNMLATLLPIDRGEARIFGYDVRSEGHAVRQLIGVTGQFASVDENLTARENLWLFGRLQGLSSQAAHSTGDDLLAQFDLTEAAHRPISQFSGGMRRRLDLAASLITRPALIFLDEPTTGLDPRNRGQMWDTIRDRKVAEGTPAELKSKIGTSSLRVHLAESADRASALALAADLTSNTPIVSSTGSAFSVQLSHANDAADVLIALRNHQLDITSATVEQPSLDEVFMALTGRSSESPVPETETSDS